MDSSPTKSQNKLPILKLEKQGLTVYSDHLQFETDVFDIHSITNLDTKPTLKQIKSEVTRVYFSDSDIVFTVDTQQNTFKLSKIHEQKSFVQFVVHNNQERELLHQILKKKWVQMGYDRKFTQIKQLGKGSTAKVYLVERKQDKKLFAAKVISLKLSDQKTYDSFINEAQILRLLKSPYIVGLEGLYLTKKKQLVEVLEYLNGGTLLDELKEDRLVTEKDKFQAIKDLTLGLEHLRVKRIAHRDLKLENVLIHIDSNGNKKYAITDFGLASWIGERNIIFQKCGTPGYIAPEVLREQKGICLLTHSSDIFSLGVLFHYIYLRKGVFKFEGNVRRLLEVNREGNVDLSSSMFALHKSQYKILQVTLYDDPSIRASSKDLLEKFIPKIEEFVFKGAKTVRQTRQLSKVSPEKTQKILAFIQKQGNSNKNCLKEARQASFTKLSMRIEKSLPLKKQLSQSRPKKDTLNKQGEISTKKMNNSVEIRQKRAERSTLSRLYNRISSLSSKKIEIVESPAASLKKKNKESLSSEMKDYVD